MDIRNLDVNELREISTRFKNGAEALPPFLKSVSKSYYDVAEKAGVSGNMELVKEKIETVLNVGIPYMDEVFKAISKSVANVADNMETILGNK